MSEDKYILNIEVTKDNVTIINKEKIHKGEYKATKCVFNFSEDFDGLTKKAIFETQNELKEMPIIDNKCDIPVEILLSGDSECNLRVYGYDLEENNGEETYKIRYSPAYDTFPIWRGSYIPNAEQGEEITPTQFEQYTNALNQGLEEIDGKILEVDSKMEEVDVALENVNNAITETNNLDLDVSKNNKTTTVTLTKKDGTTKEVEIDDGEDGKDGEDGYTPVKGVDYYTEEEIQGIVNEITEKAERDVNMANMVYNALPKVTGSGEEITLNNTAETPIKLELKPSELSQETTTGKNLFNALTGRTEKTPSGGLNGTRDFLGNGIYKGFTRNNYYIPNNVSSYSIIDNNNIALSVETSYYGLAFDFIVEPNTDYIVNFTSLNEGVFVGAGFFDEDGNYIDNVSNAKNGFTTPSTCKYVLLSFTKNSTGNISFSDVQLEEGNSSTPFEPYTNGASPNPDYPQEIHTITGDNEIKIENKNLFDTELELGTINDITGVPITSTTTIRTKDFIKVIPNNNYKLSVEGEGYNIVFYEYDKNQNFIRNKTVARTNYLTTTENTYYIKFRPYAATTDTTLKIMLNKGQTIETYEPHKEQVFSIPLGVENLFNQNDVIFISGVLDDNGNPSASTYSHYTENFYKVEPNKPYTISGTLNDSESSIRIYYYNNNKQWISRSTGYAGSNPITFTTPANCNYIRIQTRATITLKTNDVQLEKGTKASSYSEYGVAPLEYCEIGNYSDEFIYNTTDTNLELNKWYLKKNIGKVVLDGGEDENWEKPSTNRFNIACPIQYPLDIGKYYLSNLYVAYNPTSNNASFNTLVENVNYGFNLSSNNPVIRVKDTRADNISDFKTALSTSNLVVYIPYATPTYTLLNNTLQEVLTKLYNYAYSYQNETNISQVNDNLPITMNAEAVRDLSSIFDL